ncbi:MAG: hypothetical protein KDA95_00965 [Acidimicrobiales bacterium]|nr:hypothetical protein [Acidimicrobiales bacterium]
MKRLAAAVLLVALVSVGCSSSNDKADKKDSSTSTTKADASDEKGEGTSEDEAKEDTKPTKLDEAALGKAFATSLSSGEEGSGALVLEKEAADCIGPKWAAAVGVEPYEKAGLTIEQISTPFTSSSLVTLTDKEGSAQFAAFGECGVDIVRKMTESIVGGLEEAQRACVLEKMDPDLAEAALSKLFSGQDAQTEYLAMMTAVSQACNLPMPSGE